MKMKMGRTGETRIPGIRDDLPSLHTLSEVDANTVFHDVTILGNASIDVSDRNRIAERHHFRIRTAQRKMVDYANDCPAAGGTYCCALGHLEIKTVM
jgi:hypothetical protein